MIQSQKKAAVLLPFLLLAWCAAGAASEPLGHSQAKIYGNHQNRLTTSAFEDNWTSDDVIALDEDTPLSTPSFLTQTFPRMEVRSSKDFVKVIAELPGVSQGNMELTANSDILCIAGKRHAAAGDKVIMSELPAGTFKRRVRLPYPVQAELSDASLKDGILTVTLPRWRSAEAPKKISISATERRCK